MIWSLFYKSGLFYFSSRMPALLHSSRSFSSSFPGRDES
ncbi:prolyl-tRNA synthetase [Bacillus sp. NRRL B-14911]|uniref:Uncharacterized protein n=1 Tax=Bacillus infantis NRRL B-14911 TaxID=1367477 RepID=U5L9A3_9BACI|nr:hypothetical protein N288_06900 [Bacillus infantis NRRL B-14911]EAR63986.1 prolyl-tRNA synthetase [Bacillus sp. NRRL B-14911]